MIPITCHTDYQNRRSDGQKYRRLCSTVVETPAGVKPLFPDHKNRTPLDTKTSNSHDTGMATKMAETLKRLRKRRGWTQPVLARKAGLAEVSIARLECGMRTDPRISTLRKLAKALKVPITTLLD
jgi:DNA-binding XRE family transcriptional regulator